MSTNKNTVHYSASDIEKYRKGELSAGEMHDLEQTALDDPFLADAIEGLVQHPVSQQDLTDLQDKLNKKVTQDTRRKAIQLIRRRIAVAAALILLVGIGFTFFYRQPNQPQSGMQTARTAKDKAPVAAVPTAPAAAVPATPATRFKAATDNADSIDLAITQPRSSYIAQPPTRRKTPPITGETTSTSSAAPAVALYKKSAPFPDQSAPFPDSAKLAADLRRLATAGTKVIIYNIPDHVLETDSVITPSLNRSPSSIQYFNFRATDPLVYSGKVLDINNRPLAGASLNLKGALPPGTTTDNEGFFKLNVPRTDTTLQLTVSLIGYNQTSLALNNQSFEAKSSNVIYLKPSNTNLDEVVVTGYGAKRRATQASAPSISSDRLDTNWISAAPVVGRQAYLQYIRLTIGKLGLDSTITGTESVSFIVSRDGSLSAFKIEQSLSPAHDAAIIRLVTEGPAWRLFGNKKVRAAVTLNF
jgi:hypothetical protein